jgi:hypothetical protein
LGKVLHHSFVTRLLLSWLIDWFILSKTKQGPCWLERFSTMFCKCSQISRYNTTPTQEQCAHSSLLFISGVLTSFYFFSPHKP